MLGGGRSGLRRAAHRRRRPAVALCRGGGVPEREQWRGGVGEHRWRAWKLLGGSVLEDGGRRSELHGSRATAAMGAAASARRCLGAAVSGLRSFSGARGFRSRGQLEPGKGGRVCSTAR